MYEIHVIYVIQMKINGFIFCSVLLLRELGLKTPTQAHTQTHMQIDFIFLNYWSWGEYNKTKDKDKNWKLIDTYILSQQTLFSSVINSS